MQKQQLVDLPPRSKDELYTAMLRNFANREWIVWAIERLDGHEVTGVRSTQELYQHLHRLVTRSDKIDDDAVLVAFYDDKEETCCKENRPCSSVKTARRKPPTTGTSSCRAGDAPAER